MSPLEELVTEYIRTAEGDYEQVEPQVYDVALPDTVTQKLQLPTSENGLCRITFDTEALTDHPDAQLLAFGHPTLDQIFALAHQQGAVGKIFLSGFNLQPHHLLMKVGQQLRIPKELHLQCGVPRILHFTLWFYWFQATFICDEKIQQLFEIGIDQYHGRLTRRLQELLACAQAASAPAVPYPDAGGIAVIDAYLLARSEATTKLRPIIRTYREKLTHYLSQESAQIIKYFDSTAAELEERCKKSVDADNAKVSFQQQKLSLELEREARLLELRKKMGLKIELKLLNLLSVMLPKIAIPLKLTSKRNLAMDLTAIWNPISEAIEPIACPKCRTPVLELIQDSQGMVHCPHC